MYRYYVVPYVRAYVHSLHCGQSTTLNNYSDQKKERFSTVPYSTELQYVLYRYLNDHITVLYSVQKISFHLVTNFTYLVPFVPVRTYVHNITHILLLCECGTSTASYSCNTRNMLIHEGTYVRTGT